MTQHPEIQKKIRGAEHFCGFALVFPNLSPHLPQSGNKYSESIIQDPINQFV